MVELKTKETSASVTKFLKGIEHPVRRADGLKLLGLFKEITKEKPTMWGASIVGFGNIHYKYKSGREGEWMATGFSPRKHSLSLYLLSGFKGKEELLAKLGKHKTGRGCLYINALADVDLKVLKRMIKESYRWTVKTQSVC